jgi:DNA invertase Pin-like site-specific DNA recombinase
MLERGNNVHLRFPILGARARIQERILAGLARARAQGTRLGRRRSGAVRRLDECEGLSHAPAAVRLDVSVATVKRWRRALRVGSESSSSVA